MTTSFIIPVFNEERFLPLLLESIERQSCQPDEIVFCDNMSTDHSVEVIQAYRNRLPIILTTESKKGIKPTLETAWHTAKGDILLRVDADTVLPVHWIRNVMAHFESDPSLVGLSGPWLPSDGSLIHRILPPIFSYFAAYLYQLIRGFPILMGCNCAFKRACIVSVDGYSTNVSSHYVHDDQLLTNKFHEQHYLLKWFSDCLAYHSTRRFQEAPSEYFYAVAANIHPKYYHEKKE